MNMNTKLTLFLLLIAFGLQAQTEYNYELQTNADSTFNLLVIEQVNAERSNIQMYSNLDTASVKARLYADINATYERIARKQREIDDQMILRSRLFQALRAQNLDNYIIDTRAQLDSFYIAQSWRYVTSDGTDEELNTVFVAGSLTRLRNAANENVAVIAPLSRNNVVVRFYPLGSLDVEMYSNDSRVYAGRDENNVRHILVRRR